MPILRRIVWISLICVPLQAAGVALVLNPPGGSLLILPGQTSGWDFTLDNQTADWISVTSSALTFETNSSIGAYSDFIGLQGGPLPSFAVAPFTSWSELFDGVSQGLGSYAVFLSAAPFAEDSGEVLVNFDVFNGDPTTGGAQTGSSSVSAAFTVDVGALPPTGTPEPSTMALSALALVSWSVRKRRVSPQPSAFS